MGLRLLEDKESGLTAMYSSTTDLAFGPVFPNIEAAEKFLSIYDDVRAWDDKALMDAYRKFTNRYVCECGNVREDEADCPNCKDGIEHKAGDARVHVDTDGAELKCWAEPAPPEGERFRCEYCKRRDAEEAERKRKAVRK